MFTASTAPDPRCNDIPVWKCIEVADGKTRTTFWCARLWTGQLLKFKTEKEARTAYWR